jgi:DNA-binding transcriptional ArsR family regulator
MDEPSGTLHLRDPSALRALAHPTRVALLSHLMALGPRTASQCAEAVGETPSTCSWHMRQLARFGFVERADSDDGRERPWRAAVTGFASDPEEGGSGKNSLAHALLLAQVRDEEQALLRHLEARDVLDPAWREASAVHTYHLVMSAVELAALERALDQAIRPFIALTRQRVPADARPVRLHLRAYRGEDGS